MSIDTESPSDSCERLLYASLVNAPNRSYHERKHLRQALKWYQGNKIESPSLVECMTVLRVVGEGLLIRLDDGVEYKYLRFDGVRNRVVLINPAEGLQVPLEETNISELFDECLISFVRPDEMVEKKFRNVTVVSNNEYGDRIVLGEYTDVLIQYAPDGAEITYEPDKVIELPQLMTPEKVDQWLHSQDSNGVKNYLSESV